MTRPSAYVEHTGARWEAWTWNGSHALTVAHGPDLIALCDAVERDGYRVVEIPLRGRGR